MKNTRRTFLQSLASIPLLGWAFASAKPAMPSLPPVKVGTSRSIYGFDEQLTLSGLYGQTVFTAGEQIQRWDFVALDGVCRVIKARPSDQPIGMALRSFHVGDEVQDHVLVRGRVV